MRRRVLGSLLLVLVASACVVAARAGAQSGGPTIAGCPLLPADNIWNTRVDTLPIHPRSSDYVAAIGRDRTVHPDFGSGTWDGGPIGIPYTTVPGTQPRVPISFYYADESDAGPYPIPANAPIEGGPNSTGDRHVLVVDTTTCKLYEVYDAHPQPDGSWHAGSGAVFGLGSNALRPAGWTSADAAGLPILPGLVRYDEVATGEIRHALRFTAPVTQRLYVWPARHYASSNTSPSVPPMGQRFRLRASFDVSPFPPTVQVLLRALQRYGMMLADNGSSWYVSGAPDPRWNNDQMVGSLRLVKGSDFEAVDVSGLMVAANSGQVGSGPPPPKTYALTVAIKGQGTVKSIPAGISCSTGTTCTAGFAQGTTVTLTPTSGRFRSWSGACNGSGPCVVSMTKARSVTAVFR